MVAPTGIANRNNAYSQKANYVRLAKGDLSRSGFFGIVPPDRVKAIAISGITKLGVTLNVTSVPGVWIGNPAPVLTRQWTRDGVDVAGKTAGTDLMAAADVGKMIACRLTNTNAWGASTVVTPSVGPIGEDPANTVLPVIAGILTVGSVLNVTATPGTWTGTPAPTISWQWTRDTVNIAGATASSYTLVAGDAGTMIACKVTGTNVYSAVVATTAAVGPIA